MADHLRWVDLRNRLGRDPDRMPLIRFHCAVTGYKPLPKQLNAHRVWSRDVATGDMVRKLATGGFGGGKTHWEINEMAMAIVGNPGTDFLFTAPTNDQSQYVLLPPFLRVMDAYAKAGYPLMKRYKPTFGVAEMHDGSHGFFRTFGKLGSLVGREFGVACVDEVDTVKNARRVWQTVASRVRQACNGRLMIGATTPDMGLDGVCGVFHGARQDDEPEQHTRYYWTRFSGMDNPHLPRGYYEGMRQSMSKREWKVLVEGRILKPSGVIFPEFGKQTHGIPWRYDPTLDYHLAYDAGDNNPVILWVQAHPTLGLIVFDEMVESMPIGRLHDEIVRRCRRLGKDPEVIAGDRAVPKELQWCQQMFPRTHVKRMRSKAEQEVAYGIERVRALLDPFEGDPHLWVAEHLFDNPQRKGLVPAFLRYRYRKAGDGSITSRPYKDNIHDHANDAISYLVRALAKMEGGGAVTVQERRRGPRMRW